MTPEIRPEFKGPLIAQVYRDDKGPTDYVRGPGADMVPRRIGDGRFQVFAVLRELPAEVDPKQDGLLLKGLSRAGVEAVRARVEELQGKDGKGEVTEEAILKALAA